MKYPDEFVAATGLSSQVASQSAAPFSTAELSPGGINVLHSLKLGGVDQAIHISGEHADLPILLFLHGGPGFPHMPFAHANAELCHSFLVVHWDQRGAGKSFSSCLGRQDLSIEQLVSDAHELLLWLRAAFQPRALILVGHSWGSALGAFVAARYPQLISGFVGIGQVTNLKVAEKMRYMLCLELASMHHDTSTLEALRLLGAPPYKEIYHSEMLEDMASRLASFFYRPVKPEDFDHLSNSSPVYSREDVLRIPLGRHFSEQCLWGKMVSEINLFQQVPQLNVPACFIVGQHDTVSMHKLVIDYFDQLHAPRGKSFVTMHASGHWPHLEQAKLFRSVLVSAHEQMTEMGRN